MFNALKYTEELEKAGFTRVQAEASVKLLIDAMNENFATKADLTLLGTEIRTDMNALKTELKTEMRELRVELKGEMRELEYRMTIKLGTMMMAMITLAVGTTAAVVKMIH